MDTQRKPLSETSCKRIVAVPLRAVGAGLRLLLKTGLLPPEIRGLRFACNLDRGKDPPVTVLVNVDRTRGSVACELPSELRGALEQCFCRFLIRSRRAPLAALGDVWEWDSCRDI